MIVKEYDSIRITNNFKQQISFNCGFYIKFGYKVNIRELIIMIHKHGGHNMWVGIRTGVGLTN